MHDLHVVTGGGAHLVVSMHDVNGSVARMQDVHRIDEPSVAEGRSMQILHALSRRIADGVCQVSARWWRPRPQTGAFG
jgi:hypothetical protein